MRPTSIYGGRVRPKRVTQPARRRPIASRISVAAKHHLRPMALPLPPGLVPAEAAFLCEMELVTVVPRQRLDPIRLLGGTTPALRPPHRAVLPLWLALLLKRQRRCSIVAPPWLHPASLQELVVLETRVAAAAADASAGHGAAAAPPIQFSPPPPPPARADGRTGAARRPFSFSGDSSVPLSPPFLPSCTAEAPAGFLPYHWLEVAEILLAHAPDDLPAPPGDVRALLRDLAEARGAKVRQLTAVANAAAIGSADGDLGGGGSSVRNLRGIGAMELAETRGLVVGLHDGVRRLGAAAEASRREEEDDEDLAAGGAGGSRGRSAGYDAANRGGGRYNDYDDDSDDDMGI